MSSNVVRVGLITTLSTNLGDDIVRAGIVNCLKRTSPGTQFDLVLLNKHRPMQVYPQWHPARLADRLPCGKATAARMASSLLHRFGGHCFQNCDLIIYCGSPIMWNGCAMVEWAGPLWKDIVVPMSRKIPVLNLASGSCYPWENLPSELAQGKDRDFLESVFSTCDINVVRDALARDLAEPLLAEGRIETLPCSALLWHEGRLPLRDNADTVFLNYMEGGGHFDFRQGIEPSIWRGVFVDFIENLRESHTLAFICHDKKEYTWAAELAPDLPKYLLRKPEDYLEIADRCRAAVCNRLHACMALASLGIPSAAIGTDSRMLMLDYAGIPTLYAKEADSGTVRMILEQLLQKETEERQRLAELKARTFASYEELLSNELTSILSKA
ncbi:MAG: polysaccharide pyruvyl transferase family protein [Kiritimatiellia bacterium]|jgi:hypothetical protein|nr:polysaccharide pyruvyl transferase family protein [Kiritimatiellia bacterium]MDP6847889.1 polysaccharide pyruvyl transferase family protein [Kiritimatiellia bacterium]